MVRKKHILLLNELKGGGELVATLRLVKKLGVTVPATRFSLIAFSVGRENLDLSQFNNKIVLKRSQADKPLSFVRKLLMDFLRVRREIHKLNNREKIDIILFTDYLMGLSAGFTLRKPSKIFLFHGIKHVPFQDITQFDYRQQIIRSLERLAVIVSSRVAVPTKEAAFYINKFLYPFHKNNIDILPNSIPENYFKPANRHMDAEKSDDFAKGSRVLLYSGRVGKFKGLENLISAIALANSGNPSYELVIAYPESGVERDYFLRLKNLVGKLGVAPFVKFYRSVPERKLIKLYQQADLCVLPSELEFAPLCVLESISLGTPVIATRVGNIPEILQKIDRKLLLVNNSPIEILNGLNYYFSLPKIQKSAIIKRCLKVSLKYKDKSNPLQVAKMFGVL